MNDSHFDRARNSIRIALARLSQSQHYRPTSRNLEARTALQAQRDILKANLKKLDGGVVRIAAFGLVSRGKSTVLNALLGQNLLETGPINGVTKWPRSILWAQSEDETLQVELIDTPGLDEVGGFERSQMARDVARQADLILFIVAGDITSTEYRALSELWETHKPLILVFNKVDLYPDRDREAIYRQLQKLGRDVPLRPEEIVRVAAAPMSVQVRQEWPDGRVTQEWETPAPDVSQLRQTLLDILSTEGRSLLALNALVQARDAQETIARSNVELRDRDAEELIWQFARYKAVAVGVNPVAVLDVFGGAISDLVMIRSLAQLYGLPMTSYEATKLWKTILFSGGGLLLGELGTNAVFGLGKGVSGAAMGLPGFAGAAIAQGAIAGYGAYAVGQAAQVYLERGCTWGELGADTIIRDILARVDRDSILDRLRQELRS
ncbi:MAG: GTP-binding protein [Cyanobacteriota bacterium]|nr:GTP-binding protein [Cyanobacteriota bacterium]